MRLDLYLVSCGKFESRSGAQEAIKNGYVKIDGVQIKKSSYDINNEIFHEVSIDYVCPYVSRGGLKLKYAIDSFNISCDGKIAVDIGASTGGFTDCLLQQGVTLVYAFDNGEGQLHTSLLQDNRVISRERFNARLLSAADIPQAVDIVVMDVSFISQKHIIKNVYEVLAKSGEFISLIKPQFELTKADLNKRGIVKDERVRVKACESVVDYAVNCGFSHIGTVTSPINGGDGNIEYLAYFIKG